MEPVNSIPRPYSVTSRGTWLMGLAVLVTIGALAGLILSAASLANNPLLDHTWQWGLGASASVVFLAYLYFGAQRTLFWAIREGHTDIAKALLASGTVDPDGTNSTGESPLYVTCAHGRTEIAEALLAYDAKVQSEDISLLRLWKPDRGHAQILQLAAVFAFKAGRFDQFDALLKQGAEKPRLQDVVVTSLDNDYSIDRAHLIGEWGIPQAQLTADQERDYLTTLQQWLVEVGPQYIPNQFLDDNGSGGTTRRDRIEASGKFLNNFLRAPIGLYQNVLKHIYLRLQNENLQDVSIQRKFAPMFQSLLRTGYHCIDGIANLFTDVYYRYVAEVSMDDKAGVFRVLAQHRTTLFKNALDALTPGDVHQAATARYYFDAYKNYYGLISNGPSMFNYCAQGVGRFALENRFEAQYTPTSNAKALFSTDGLRETYSLWLESHFAVSRDKHELIREDLADYDPIPAALMLEYFGVLKRQR